MPDLILYVEDDALSREVMALVIEDVPQYELVVFADSHNFLARVDALPQVPLLILLDIHVQPITGFEMLVGSSRVDLQACKLEYSIVSPK